MFKWVPEDCEVVIWAYIVETLSLRDGLPEKQSPKRGVATWASAMGNKKARKRNEGDIGERERGREESGKPCEHGAPFTIAILVFSTHHHITLSLVHIHHIITDPPSSPRLPALAPYTR
jgi:hypothetical protein